MPDQFYLYKPIANLATLLATPGTFEGEAYYTLDTMIVYIWSGTAWVHDGHIIVEGGGGVSPSTTVNGHPLSANVTVTKGDVGLSSVDNKSEATIITDTKADADVASAISLKHSATGQINQVVQAKFLD